MRAGAACLVSSALLLSGCDRAGRDGSAAARANADAQGSATAGDSTGMPAAPAAAAAARIRTDGIGDARRGMTIGDLRAALPAGTTLGPPRPFMVDISAMSVVQERDTLYHVLIVSGEPSSDDTPITVVGTMNPSFRTAEGVGPGTTLQDAARIYGPPRLTYNTNDESREYAHFPDVPDHISMRVTPSLEDGVFAGIYQTEGEYNETAEYDPAAVIAFVIVSLRGAPDGGSQ